MLCNFCLRTPSFHLADGTPVCLHHAYLELTMTDNGPGSQESKVMLFTDTLLRIAQVLGPTFGCDNGCDGCTVEGQNALDLATDALGITPIVHG